MAGRKQSPQISLLPENCFQVAIVDADPHYCSDVRGLFSADSRFETHIVASLGELEKLIERVDLDCALISAEVGEHNAFVVHDRIVMAFANPPAAIMVVTEGSERNAVKAFRSGFVDYLRKATLDSAGLRSSVAKASSARRERLREKDQIQQLSDMAMRDSLTGLSNRNALESHLSMLMETGLRHGKPFSVILIDINHFKHINDTFGHFIGDHALKEFAKKLKLHARSSDVYGRLGGDEFLYMIGESVTLEAVRSACERLLRSLTFNIELENLGFAIHASIGAAIYPLDGKTAQDLLKAADRAMYQAKTTKSGTFLAFDLPSVAPTFDQQQSREAGPEPGDSGDENGAAVSDSADAEDISPDGASHGGLSVAEAAEPSVLPTHAAQSGLGAAPQPDVSDLHAPYNVHRLGNRRAEQRHRVLKKATVYSTDGMFTIDCIVRDLSTGGARISVAGEFCLVPDHFNLVMAHSGETFPAEKRWQRGGEVGLMFLGAHGAAMHKARAPGVAEPVAHPRLNLTAGNKAPPRAFVIDDDPQICGLLSKALVRRGYVASEHSALREIEAALALIKPELIVLDLSLGETDAIEVMRSIAASRFSGHILLISGHDMMTLDEVRKIGERGGHKMLPVLRKPFRIQEFGDRLELVESVPTGTAKEVLLTQALDNGWLEVWYQPKIDLRNMTICGSEALSRIRHPDRGVLFPKEFLPITSHALLKRFSDHVLETALNDWSRIAGPSIAHGQSPHRLAINLPTAYLLGPGFIDNLRRHLPKDKIFPGFIVEITEDETISEPETVREIAFQLRLHNISMSIDDFGAGQSNIARLAQLPFTEIKLDRSFVHGCATDETKKTVCLHVLDLARRAGLLALAEGVEDPADLEAVISMGFDLAQGFIFAKAMTRDELIDVLEATTTAAK